MTKTFPTRGTNKGLSGINFPEDSQEIELLLVTHSRHTVVQSSKLWGRFTEQTVKKKTRGNKGLLFYPHSATNTSDDGNLGSMFCIRTFQFMVVEQLKLSRLNFI